MRRSDSELVRALPLFRAVSASSFDTLMRDASVQRFVQNTLLIKEGDLPQALHIVVEGAVELVGYSAERETTLDIIHPITTFILAAVIRDQAYLKSARTLTSAKIVSIPANAIRDVFNRDDCFARAVAAELAVSCGRTIQALKDLKLCNAAERLANWILQCEQEQGNHGQIRLRHAKQTLASRLGMTPENLSRNLSSLEKHGVSIKGRVMVITDPAALRRLAKGEFSMDGS